MLQPWRNASGGYGGYRWMIDHSHGLIRRQYHRAPGGMGQYELIGRQDFPFGQAKPLAHVQYRQHLTAHIDHSDDNVGRLRKRRNSHGSDYANHGSQRQG